MTKILINIIINKQKINKPFFLVKQALDTCQFDSFLLFRIITVFSYSRLAGVYSP
jgi:hypothetical protein